MVVREPGGDGDDMQAVEPLEPAAPSKEIARRPVTEIQFADESPTRGRQSGVRKTVRAATGVARVAVTAATEVAAWSFDTALGVGATVVRGSVAGAPPREVLAEAEAEVRDAVRRALRLPATPEPPDPAALPTLREQGAALLRLSASTQGEHSDSHPAFARMLADLTLTRHASCVSCISTDRSPRSISAPAAPVASAPSESCPDST